MIVVGLEYAIWTLASRNERNTRRVYLWDDQKIARPSERAKFASSDWLTSDQRTREMTTTMTSETVGRVAPKGRGTNNGGNPFVRAKVQL